MKQSRVKSLEGHPNFSGVAMHGMKIAGTFQVTESLVGTGYEATHYVYC